MKRFEFFCSVALTFSVLAFVAAFCRKQTDTFTIAAIASARPFNPEWATRPLLENEQEELKAALDQPYTYFGCGGQAYAFFSADGKYVVKFFKQRLFRPSLLLNHFPIPPFLHRYREKRNWKRLDKLKRDFFSYWVAFQELQEQTGLLYVHLNKTKHLKQKLEIIDRLNIHHEIDLDQFDFVVQRMAVRCYDKIDTLMKSGRLEEAEEGIQSIFSLISERAKMGYRDRDPNIRTNCGFIGKDAVKIDVGRFVISEAMKTKRGHNEELLRITQPFREWIEERHPELISSFETQLEETLL